MYLVISPAKTLDFDTPPQTTAATQPQFLTHAQTLIDTAKALSPDDISALMKISDKLGLLNFERFQDWHTPFSLDNAKQAILAFKGDVYTGLDADSLSDHDLQWANAHLGILSGLYGLLRPLDLMQPYRLEMGTKFQTNTAKDLYGFWGDTITEAINAQLHDEKHPVLINLASNEYFSAINTRLLAAKVITPVFKDEKNGQYKIISFYAKKARGLMARWIIEQRLTDYRDLKKFAVDGYYFVADDSTDNTVVFHRDSMG